MAKRKRKYPVPTAHRLAAWLSLARGVTHRRAKDIRFLPLDDDIIALRRIWRERLKELSESGTWSLRPRRYSRAMACKPNAFSYAGTGQSCRLYYCPFCNAAGAAETYERLILHA